MTETLYISKESKDKYSTAEVKQVFTNSDNLEEIKAYVEKAEDRLFVSWASVDGVDKDNQKIPISLVIKAQDELMKRGAPIMYRHTNKNVGKTLAYKVAQHPDNGKLGVLHLNMIYSGMPIDEQVWTEIKSGKLKGLSVGGQGVIGSREYDDKTQSLVDVYSAYGQYETSIVENPANPLALNEVVSAIAKEEKMAEENNFDDIVKELKETITSLQSEISEIKKSLEVKEVVKEEVVPVNSEQVSEEPIEKAEEKKAPSIEERLSNLEKMLENQKECGVKKEEPAKTEVQVEDAKKEEVTKEETQEIVKEEIIVTEAPAVKDLKKEDKLTARDITKEYNDIMADFDAGKVSYEEVLNKFRG